MDQSLENSPDPAIQTAHPCVMLSGRISSNTRGLFNGHLYFSLTVNSSISKGKYKVYVHLGTIWVLKVEPNGMLMVLLWTQGKFYTD